MDYIQLFYFWGQRQMFTALRLAGHICPGLGLFKSYSLITLTHSRLDGANKESRVFRAWKGMEKCMVDNAHLLKQRFILSRRCLGEAVPAASKRTLHYQNTGFEEQLRPTELNGLPSWCTDGCGKTLVEITLNKPLWTFSPRKLKRTWGYLATCNVWHLSLFCQL